ncbi:MAG: EamA family transporter [Nitrospiraceae bacterium]|nr:EamA family transporter [Nitrospiraceae bacterium]
MFAGTGGHFPSPAPHVPPPPAQSCLRPLPTRLQWRNAALIGGLILVGGTGSVALAQERAVSSGLAATLVATVPLWTMIFNLYWREKPNRWEWLGVGLGICGVALLTLEDNLQSNPIGILMILFAAACWAFGSVLRPHLEMPKGMMANAAQMLLAGLMFFAFSFLRGEAMLAAPTSETLLALLYLITFGSLAAMTAYMYLLSNVSSLLATSYTFVNPAIALFLGVILGGEILTGSAFIALPLILMGVGFVAYQNRKGS